MSESVNTRTGGIEMIEQRARGMINESTVYVKVIVEVFRGFRE